MGLSLLFVVGQSFYLARYMTENETQAVKTSTEE